MYIWNESPAEDRQEHLWQWVKCVISGEEHKFWAVLSKVLSEQRVTLCERMHFRDLAASGNVFLGLQHVRGRHGSDLFLVVHPKNLDFAEPGWGPCIFFTYPSKAAMQVKAWVQTDFGGQGLLSAPGIFPSVEAGWHPLRSNALGVDLRGSWRLPHYMNWCMQEGK